VSEIEAILFSTTLALFLLFLPPFLTQEERVLVFFSTKFGKKSMNYLGLDKTSKNTWNKVVGFY
jgi:hypothetical protein